MDTYNFFWIASSEYFKEARASAESVKVHHPEAKLNLFTGESNYAVHGVFTDIYHLPKMKTKYWFLNSANYLVSALSYFDDSVKLVYLDTDTYVCAPLDDLFKSLDKFEFMGAHAPGRSTAPTVSKVPEAFPEFNIGVNGIVNTEDVRRFFRSWVTLYEKHKDVYRNNDQSPLREAIWRYMPENITFGTLPTEFNFRFGVGGQVRELVRVLHGRSEDHEELAKHVNEGYRSIRAWRSGELK